MKSSPLPGDTLDINGGELDPFKPRRAIPNSPPRSPRTVADAIDNNLPLEGDTTSSKTDNTPAPAKKVLK